MVSDRKPCEGDPPLISPSKSDSDRSSSYRQTVRSFSILGLASVINVALGIARLKAAALLVGPVGVGMIGLCQSLVTSASTIAALGISSAGTRQLAEARASEDEARLAAARRALMWLTIGLMGTGTLSFWLLSDWIASGLLNDKSLGELVAWLSVGVGISVATMAQSAFLLGFRRIGDNARVTVFSAVAAAVFGVGALLWLGEGGIVLFVLLPPAAALLGGLFYVRKLPPVTAGPTPMPQLTAQWRVLAGLGFAFMIGGGINLIAQLLVRVLAQRELGPVGLGMYQAVWALSMTYIGFVLPAMAGDYYPRLTAAIRDRTLVNRLVNEQTEVALLICGPAFLAMLAAAPIALHLFFSSEFVDAAQTLRWQVMSDVLKMSCWPLGILVLALGAGRTFILGEGLSSVVLVLLAWLLMPLLGLAATGIASVGMYLFYLVLLLAVARRRTGFAWSRQVKFNFLSLFAACGLVFAMSAASEVAALILGGVMTIAAAILALYRLKEALPVSIASLLPMRRRD